MPAACASNEMKFTISSSFFVFTLHDLVMYSRGSASVFYDAKCSCRFPFFVFNCLDFFLFQQRRKLKFLELLTLPDRAQSMNRPNKTHDVGIFMASAPKPFFES